MSAIRRREFIAGIGGAAACSYAVWAQQTMPVVGLVRSGAPDRNENILVAFRNGLSEIGFVEGRNVSIEYRWGQNQSERHAELVADLIRRRVAVIATPGSTTAALAAKSMTTTIPIVFSIPHDPVELGLVESLNRPGGNVTGITSINSDLFSKQLGLLHELVPRGIRFAFLLDRNTPTIARDTREMQTAGRALGREVEVLVAGSIQEVEAAFATLEQLQVGGLVIAPSTLFSQRHVQLVALATYYRIPVIYSSRLFSQAGGLMVYGSLDMDQHRQGGIYTGRILKGENPSDLPIMRARKFEFIINLPTARLLGVSVPPTLLAIADEVIE
jgi:putative tryptophan/tyrosine transport system substrate-binding protein